MLILTKPYKSHLSTFLNLKPCDASFKSLITFYIIIDAGMDSTKQHL